MLSSLTIPLRKPFCQDVLRVLRARKGTVAVAMSGGIDSSVAAMILKDQGYDCVGVFMRNWDSSDEVGGITCSIDRDREHMREVCRKLDIPAVDVDFVKDYWNEVFTPFLDAYRSGIETPNPDVMCNRLIKFRKFREHVTQKLGIRTIATGHYVRIDPVRPLPRLLKGLDDSKDQSYFLSMTPGENLTDVLFPVGALHKHEVKRMAAERFKGLAVLTKKESMGVCFIGKRNMPEFLSNYMQLTPGRFVDVDSGLEIGRHDGKEALTVGQGAKIGGCTEKYFIASLTSGSGLGEEVRRGDVLVAKGSHHPALYCTSLRVRADRMSWVAGIPPIELLNQLDALRLKKISKSNGKIDSGSSGDDEGSNSCEGGFANTSCPDSSTTNLLPDDESEILIITSPELPDLTGLPGLRCGFKARYQQVTAECTVSVRLLPHTDSIAHVGEGGSGGNMGGDVGGRVGKVREEQRGGGGKRRGRKSETGRGGRRGKRKRRRRRRGSAKWGVRFRVRSGVRRGSESGHTWTNRGSVCG